MEHYLEEIGLTKGEIKVYLSLLSLGQTTSGPIIAESKISSSKVYEILEKLMQKGLVSHIVKNKTKYFQATPPGKLRDYISAQEKRIAEQKEELEKHLPELLAKYGLHKPAQNAEIFLGLPAIKTMLWDIIESVKKNDEWLFFAGMGEAYEKAVDKLYIQFARYRVERQLMSRGIAHESLKSVQRKVKSTLKSRLYAIRFIDFPTPSNIGIYRDQVAIVSWTGNPIAVLITSQDIADRFRAFFESTWKIAKE